MALLKTILVFASLGLCNADFYSHTVKDSEGNPVSLEKYRGKVTLVVNVASLCGFTETSYRSLARLHDILSYDGYFSVLAFPCNQFGDQEPEDAETIANSMKQEYGVEFPILNKIDVVGEHASPAFRNLIEQSTIVPEWNFYKYLVDSDGEVLNAWGTRTEVEDIFPDIEKAIGKAKEAAQSEKEKPAYTEQQGTNKEEL